MIKKYLRVIIVIVVLMGIIVLAKNQVAWAGPATETRQVSGFGQVQPSVSLNNPGSVQAPSSSHEACEKDVFSVGGAITFEIKDLKPGYCVETDLWDTTFGVIPEDTGKVLGYKGVIRIYFHGELVYELLAADGSIQACFAIPPEKQALIYFYDSYGQRFEKRTDTPSWETIDTTVDNNIACAFTQKSGVYALIGK